ncbi:MAG: hypothetical protein WBE68_10070, partial [Candidatus Nitrosopolaris sp.]
FIIMLLKNPNRKSRQKPTTPDNVSNYCNLRFVGIPAFSSQWLRLLFVHKLCEFFTGRAGIDAMNEENLVT